MVKYNLVFFYSEGPPNDNGQNLSHNKDKLLEIAGPHFDHISWYTPKILREMGYEDYVKERPKGLVTKNKKMSLIGNCAWRPLIMLLELSKMEEGDILIYRDSNISGYRKNALSCYENIRNVVDQCLTLSEFDFFVPFQGRGKLFQHTKTNVLRELGENHPFSYDFPNLFSGLLTIARKSIVSIDFLNEWKTACIKEEWIDGKKYGELCKGFKWQCPEQSIMGVIIANWIRKKKHNISPYYPKVKFNGAMIKNMRVINKYSNWYQYLNNLDEDQKTELLKDNNKKEFNIIVGKSENNNKVITLPQQNMFVSNIPVNKQQRCWKDKFKISVNEDKLTVTRVDNNYRGWVQKLVLRAYTFEYVIDRLNCN